MSKNKTPNAVFCNDKFWIQVTVVAPVRFFSPNPTEVQEVADRVFYVLTLFDKIDQEKLSLDCRFDKVIVLSERS